MGSRRMADLFGSYGRIETLSGFANGIFLVLISLFIIFEAIQRLYVHISTVRHMSSMTSSLGWIPLR